MKTTVKIRKEALRYTISNAEEIVKNMKKTPENAFEMLIVFCKDKLSEIEHLPDNELLYYEK